MYEFHPDSKTDLVVNNVVESCNANIKDANDKPPITLMETLRKIVMNTFTTRRERLAKTRGCCLVMFLKI